MKHVASTSATAEQPHGHQALSAYIRARFDEFSRSQKDVAQYIVDHLDEAAFQTAEELARRGAGVAGDSGSLLAVEIALIHFSHSVGQTLALLATFLGIGVLVNVLIVYIVLQVMAERKQNQERQQLNR